MSNKGYISVKVLRKGQVAYPKLDGQLDKMSNVEAATYGGAAPYFRYWLYILEDVVILADDVLTDLNNVDPITGVNTIYTAVSDGETLDDNHCEVVCDRVRGK